MTTPNPRTTAAADLEETRKAIKKIGIGEDDATRSAVLASIYVGDSLRYLADFAIPDAVEQILGRLSPSVLSKTQCSGISASWCPLCGDCRCVNRDDPHGDRDDSACPLHSRDSAHGEDVDG